MKHMIWHVKYVYKIYHGFKEDINGNFEIKYGNLKRKKMLMIKKITDNYCPSLTNMNMDYYFNSTRKKFTRFIIND